MKVEEKIVNKPFLHIGVNSKSNKGRWKNRWRITQNENVDIDEFAENVAEIASGRIADRIHFWNCWGTKSDIAEEEIKKQIKQYIENVIEVDRPR
jgi:pantothenate kinase type III